MREAGKEAAGRRRALPKSFVLKAEKHASSMNTGSEKRRRKKKKSLLEVAVGKEERVNGVGQG